jgi:DNA-binding SARP family transcriptional activator
LSTGLQVKLFGCVTVLRDSRPLPPLSSKALELLCYLLLHRSRAHTREVLSGLLWPDAPESHAKKYLRQTLWQLQTNLANGASPDEPAVLDVHDGRVRLNPDGGCWTDVEVVERAHRRCGDLPIGALSDLDVVALEHAAALCQDDLLDSWGHDWCTPERDRLHLVYLDLLDRLIEHAVCRGLLGRGLAHGQRLLGLDPAREVTHRRLMRLYAVCGDRTGALRQYSRCVRALAEEFDLAPAAETVELYRRIRAGSVPVLPPHPPSARVPGPLDERLDQIADAVAALRNDVGQLLALHHREPDDRRDAWEAG